jgi:hypothetical protein
VVEVLGLRGGRFRWNEASFQELMVRNRPCIHGESGHGDDAAGVRTDSKRIPTEAMSTPPPPSPESENEPNQTGNHSAPSRHPKLSELVFGLTALCQIVNGAFTFLPWCKYFGNYSPGYLAHPSFPELYNGLPGIANLLAGAAMVLCLLHMAANRTVLAIHYCVFPLMCWNGAMFLWLWKTHAALRSMGAYGLTYSLYATLGITLSCFVILIARYKERIAKRAKNNV